MADLRSPTIMTSVQARDQIAYLSTSIPAIRDIFDKLCTSQILLRDLPAGHEILLTSTRRALYSVEDNKINDIGKELLTLGTSVNILYTQWRVGDMSDNLLCHLHRDLAIKAPYPSSKLHFLYKQIFDKIHEIMGNLR